LGDEVVIMRDNHPSNNLAWKAKGQRFGYTVREIEPASPHPGADYYVRAFREAITPNTRVISFTHLTNTAGDLFPARELCALAREHGVFSVVDGAQSFGLFDIDLSEVQPDFYTGSAHKWPCGPKETGVLYVNARVHDRFWPTMYSFRPGELSPGDVVGALENDGIVAASRGGSDRTGVRLSPHFYNSHTDVERAVSAVRGYLRTGL
ncbi:MAG: aminotransferase class V-fold PLP-dependent enzyme, partial [Bryobacterales bacterium]|nr:aminotransferase class V-fold PLP-dependent enzyme [Bryobacterales bacterium]